MTLDPNGQPPRAVAYNRNLTKAMQALLGLCQGLIADGELNPQEIHFLASWLAEHRDVIKHWPGNVVARRVAEVLEDGVITEEEAEDLKETLSKLTGDFLEHGAVSGVSTSLPLEDTAKVVESTDTTMLEFAGKVYCLTGKFVYGTRAACEAATAARGAECVKDVSNRVDYVVIGALASRDWANTSYGRKIEKAMALREQGHRVRVVSEEFWAGHI